MSITKKQLAIVLSQMEVFSSPDVALEQYPTDSEIAASVLWRMSQLGTIFDKKVLDLGCGSGILGIGALLLGARHVIFADVDEVILEVLKANIESIAPHLQGTYEIVHKDVADMRKEDFLVDVVITNPPFGTRAKGVDLLFLQKSFLFSGHVVSFHKSVTKDYVLRYYNAHGFSAEVEDFSFPLKKTLTQHKRKIQRIEVSVFYGKNYNEDL